MALILHEHEVDELLSIDLAIAAVEESFRQQAEGQASNPPRQRVRGGNMMLHVLPGALGPSVGMKFYGSSRAGARFWVVLFDAASGELLSMMQADRLGQFRTGAASGVATRYLARPDATVLGLFGTGKQAYTQAAAVCAVRPIRRIRVHGRDQQKARRFADLLARDLRVDTEVTGAEATVRESDIVTTITTSAEPLFPGEWLAPGTHVNAAGSNRAEARELDATAVGRAAVVAVDLLSQAQKESGDLIHAATAGAFDWGRAVEMAGVVAGGHGGRSATDDITLFESQGIALWDLALARRVYEAARERGHGRQVDL